MDMQVACNISSFGCAEEDSLALIIIPSLLALSTVTVILLILWSFVRKKSSYQRTTVTAQHRHALQTVSEALVPGHDALSLWEMPDHCSLDEMEFMKSGRYGPTCRAQLKQHGISTSVVVKTFKGSSCNPGAGVFMDLAAFHASVSRHDNVVRLLYCQSRRLPMYLVFEAYNPGNLLHCLWQFREAESGTPHHLQPFTEHSVYLVAKQVASGLDYLLTDHRLIHGDVAARSILIGPELLVKVSRLTVAFETRRMGGDGEEEGTKVPRKWQAPERMMRLPITARSDVWSFGIFLYELITLGDPPFPDLDPSEVLPQTLANYKLKRPQNCGGALYDLIKYCCMWNFKDRPSYSSIIRLLESYIHLADTKPLRATKIVDVSQYRRLSGLPP